MGGGGWVVARGHAHLRSVDKEGCRLEDQNLRFRKDRSLRSHGLAM